MITRMRSHHISSDFGEIHMIKRGHYGFSLEDLKDKSESMAEQ